MDLTSPLAFMMAEHEERDRTTWFSSHDPAILRDFACFWYHMKIELRILFFIIKYTMK